MKNNNVQIDVPKPIISREKSPKKHQKTLFFSHFGAKIGLFSLKNRLKNHVKTAF
jgi:hypothetical protein